MDYKELVERLNEWNENLISELCADDVLTCDDLCGCTGDCIVVQAATAITDLLARAEAAEARAEKAERERDAAVKVIERVRSCKDCGHYTGEWTPPCKECQDSEEHHPYFKWRGPHKED